MAEQIDHSGSEIPIETRRTDWMAAQLEEMDTAGKNSALISEAIRRLRFLDNLEGNLSLLADEGTAPQAALYGILAQSEDGISGDTSVVLELRKMLAPHWADWSPVLEEIAGFERDESSDDQSGI